MLPWLHGRDVRYVSLSRNFGKEAALTAGLDRARGDVVLLMDADLQHPPALIPDMLARLARRRRHGLHGAQPRATTNRC